MQKILASDFLIGFSLSDCSESIDCATAIIKIINEKNNIMVSKSRISFKLDDHIKSWQTTFQKIKRPKGRFKNPYENMLEAARLMVKDIACKIRGIAPCLKDINILVKGTRNTPENFVDFITGMLPENGMTYIPMTGKWLDVIINAQDQFEMEIYPGSHKEQMATANVVLALDYTSIHQDLAVIRAQLFTLKGIDISLKKKQHVLAAMAIPECSSSGYLMIGKKQVTIQAIGVGICNKDVYDEPLWEYSALKAANLDAMAGLGEKVKSEIITNVESSKNKIGQQKIESYSHFIIENVDPPIKEIFDEKRCVATVIVETQKSNIHSLLQKLNQQYTLETNNTPEPATKQTSIPHLPQSPKRVERNHRYYSPVSVQEAITDNQQQMVGLIQAKIREHLEYRKIKPEVINWFSLSGNISDPNCRIENHYLMSTSNVPPRNYCDLYYDINFQVQQKSILNAKGWSKGMGSSRDTAWVDALNDIEEKIFPLIYAIARVINEKRSMDISYETLKNMDDHLWRFVNDLSVESVVDELEYLKKELEALSH
jgi:DNA-binding transcriptional MerR regulator